MGHRDAGIGRCSNSSGHPWHHLDRDLSFRQISRLLSTTAKQEGIPTLQPNDGCVLLGHLHQHRIGAGLRHGMMTPTFPHKPALTALRHQVQHFFGDQGVVHKRIATAQQTMRLDCEQFRIPGACSHQINSSRSLSGGHGRAISKSIRP